GKDIARGGEPVFRAHLAGAEHVGIAYYGGERCLELVREAGDELLAPLRRLLKQLNLALQLFRLLAAALRFARRAPLSPQRKKRNEPAARRGGEQQENSVGRVAQPGPAAYRYTGPEADDDRHDTGGGQKKPQGKRGAGALRSQVGIPPCRWSFT